MQAKQKDSYLDVDGKCCCQVCGHKWRPLRDSKPVVCPKCKSYKWSDGKSDE